MNKRGFSLLEVIVGFALMSALSISVMKMTTISNKSAKMVSQSFELPIVLNGFRELLADDNICQKNFSGTVLSGGMVDFDQLIDTDDNIRYNKTKVFGNNELKIVDLKIGGFDPYDSSDPSNLRGESKIVIIFERLGQSFGTKTIKKEIEITTFVNDLTSMQIQTCSTESEGNNDGLWSRSTSGIKFIDGLVGIGVSDPKAVFHVLGGSLSTGANTDLPYAGKNSLIVIENPNLSASSNANMSIVASDSTARSGIQFADKDLADHPGPNWDGVISYEHKDDRFMMGTMGGPFSGLSTPLYLKSNGHLTLGYDYPPTDARAEQFTLDVKSDDSLKGGSGIRVQGTELVSGWGRARIILQDTNEDEWALNSMGSGSSLAGSFAIGHRATKMYPLVINRLDQVLIGHGSNPPLDVEAIKYQVEIKAKDTVASGGAIRILGNESVFKGQGRAQVMLQDVSRWALNSLGSKSPYSGAFSIGHRDTATHVVAITPNDEFGIKPPLNLGWIPVRDVEIFGDVEIKDNKKFYVSEIKAAAGSVKFTSPISAPSITTVTLTETSDIRLKTNIKEIKNPLHKILSLNGITYNWNSESGIDDNSRQMGLSAQQVEKVFPEAVIKNAAGILSIKYSALIAPLIESVKLISSEVQELKEKSDERGFD